MALRSWIKGFGCSATATPATVATVQGCNMLGIARVATVAVANAGDHEKPKDTPSRVEGPEIYDGDGHVEKGTNCLPARNPGDFTRCVCGRKTLWTTCDGEPLCEPCRMEDPWRRSGRDRAL